MLVIMKKDATPEQLKDVEDTITEMGYTANPIEGRTRSAIAVTGNKAPVDRNMIEALPGVEQTIRVIKPFRLVSRENQPEDTLVEVRDVVIGSNEFVVMSGPCSVESQEQIMAAARLAKEAGAHILRGGAFKPRTSPYSFQGLGVEGYKMLAAARIETGLPVISEVVDSESVDLAEKYIDILQVGARNMQNFMLLRRVAKSGMPVLLKRGVAATLEELLSAAEYILNEGNPRVILCERGIRGFSDFSRNTLDLSIVPAVKEISHLPIITDPSHASGRRDMILPLARASIAVGADGIIVEMHPEPERALTDGHQSLYPRQLERLISDLVQLAPIVGRTLSIKR